MSEITYRSYKREQWHNKINLFSKISNTICGSFQKFAILMGKHQMKQNANFNSNCLYLNLQGEASYQCFKKNLRISREK